VRPPVQQQLQQTRLRGRSLSEEEPAATASVAAISAKRDLSCQDEWLKDDNRSSNRGRSPIQRGVSEVDDGRLTCLHIVLSHSSIPLHLFQAMHMAKQLSLFI